MSDSVTHTTSASESFAIRSATSKISLTAEEAWIRSASSVTFPSALTTRRATSRSCAAA